MTFLPAPRVTLPVPLPQNGPASHTGTLVSTFLQPVCQSARLEGTFLTSTQYPSSAHIPRSGWSCARSEASATLVRPSSSVPGAPSMSQAGPIAYTPYSQGSHSQASHTRADHF